MSWPSSARATPAWPPGSPWPRSPGCGSSGACPGPRWARCRPSRSPTIPSSRPAGRCCSRSSAARPATASTGPPGLGPTLQNVYNHPVRLSDGSVILADEAFIRESILNPNAKVVNGYTANTMLTAIQAQPPGDLPAGEPESPGGVHQVPRRRGRGRGARGRHVGGHARGGIARRRGPRSARGSGGHRRGAGARGTRRPSSRPPGRPGGPRRPPARQGHPRRRASGGPCRPRY